MSTLTPESTSSTSASSKAQSSQPSPFPIPSSIGLNAFLYILYYSGLIKSRLPIVSCWSISSSPESPSVSPTNSYQRRTLNADFVSFTQAHYRQAAYAVGAGLTLYLVLLLPLFLIRAFVWTSSLFIDLNKSKWDDDLIDMGLLF